MNPFIQGNDDIDHQVCTACHFFATRNALYHQMYKGYHDEVADDTLLKLCAVIALLHALKKRELALAKPTRKGSHMDSMHQDAMHWSCKDHTTSTLHL